MTDQLRFGPFSFEPASGELRRQGTPLRLQPQPARVLAILVTRAGEVVSRDDLRLQIWPEGTYVDFERGLNFCIAQIRSALGDSADSPRFIETLPKRGYRFVAPVTRPGPIAVPVSSGQRTTGYGQRTLSRRGLTVAVILLLLAIGAGVAALARRGNPHAPIRVAVVPFDNETGDTDYDRIAGGVADATVARLATPERIRQVSVIGNAAVLRRPRAFRDLKVIGQE